MWHVLLQMRRRKLRNPALGDGCEIAAAREYQCLCIRVVGKGVAYNSIKVGNWVAPSDGSPRFCAAAIARYDTSRHARNERLSGCALEDLASDYLNGFAIDAGFIV